GSRPTGAGQAPGVAATEVTMVRLERCVLWVTAVLATIGAPVRTQAEQPGLVLETTIALHGVQGRIDHMAFDAGRRRLIVAELGNNTVDVVDVVAGAPVHRIAGLREPQGVGYAP